MTSKIALESTLFDLQPTCTEPAGSWKLGAERAMTLHCHEAATLRVTQGRLWATVDGPHSGPANGLGDVVLNAGERLHLRPGQRVVIESWSGCYRERGVGTAYFTWEPDHVGWGRRTHNAVINAFSHAFSR